MLTAALLGRIGWQDDDCKQTAIPAAAHLTYSSYSRCAGVMPSPPSPLPRLPLLLLLARTAGRLPCAVASSVITCVRQYMWPRG